MTIQVQEGRSYRDGLGSAHGPMTYKPSSNTFVAANTSRRFYPDGRAWGQPQGSKKELVSVVNLSILRIPAEHDVADLPEPPEFLAAEAERRAAAEAAKKSAVMEALRDQFAGHALSSLIIKASPSQFASSGEIEIIVRRAYIFADAMLKAREVSP